MNLISVLKRVSLKHILKGILFGLGRPLFIVPTIKATKDCLNIASANYGKLHQKNGPANAFRHAFWNFLIARRCLKWTKNKQKVLDWTKKVTDWHEGAFPNEALAKTMDLYNNQVGRQIFMENPDISESDAVELFKRMTDESVKIGAKSDLTALKNQLVHIIDQ